MATISRIFAVVASFVIAAAVEAASLPGFRPERLGATSGFTTSLVVDSKGTIYYTTTKGDVFRFVGGQSARVASVTTDGVGNAGLLGMALFDDTSAALHYTTPNQTHEVISRVDLVTGKETILAQLVGDMTSPGRGTPTEHHGGNPIVAPDGSVFVGIGDFGGGLIASLPEWNAGKIIRVHPDGRITQFARGLRNPYDLVWDEARQRVIVADNGPEAGDEIHVIAQGSYCGWPFTFGAQQGIDGAATPDYVFPITVAPTGLLELNGNNDVLRRGYLLAAFVTRAIYYFPDLETKPVPAPIGVIEGETGPIIDVAQSRTGELYFTTGMAIYRLHTPQRGDCNGDSLTTSADFGALAAELAEGAHATITAQNGPHRGSLGCDANADGMIDFADMSAMGTLVLPRPRPTRR